MQSFPLFLLSSLFSALVVSAGRKITVKNSCGTTVYPAYAGNHGLPTLAGGGPAPPAWELAAGGKTELLVPDNWTEGRIWLRTGACNGNVNNCLIGKCNGGGNNCDGVAYGSVGATVAEFNMGGNLGDFYDVSMVEGFTISMTITSSDSSCTVASCGHETDILAQCDPRLVWPAGSDKIWGCANSCTAGIMFTGQGADVFDYLASPSCCSWGSQWEFNCPSTNYPFYDVYKPMCKMGYIFAKDDVVPDPTAVFNCPVGASYVVDLCAGGITTGIDNPPSAADAVVQDPGGPLNVGGPSGGGGGGASSRAGGGHATSSGTGAQTTSVQPPPDTSVVIPGPSTSVIFNPHPITSDAVVIPSSIAPSSTTSSRGGGSWPSDRGDHRWDHNGHDGPWSGQYMELGAFDLTEPSPSARVCRPKVKRASAKRRIDDETE